MVRRKTWFAGSISNQTFLEDEEESTILTSEVVAPVAAATAHLTQNQYIHVVAKSSAVQSAPPSARKVDIAENDDHLPDDDRVWNEFFKIRVYFCSTSLL